MEATAYRSYRPRRTRYRRRSSLLKDILQILVVGLTTLLVCFMWPDFLTTVYLPEVQFGQQQSTAQTLFVSQLMESQGRDAAAEDARIESSLTVEDQEFRDTMLNTFPELANNERKQDALLACHKGLTELGFTSKEACTLAACAKHEGNPGLVQGSYPKQTWIDQVGVGDLLWVSSGSNPLYSDTRAKTEALLKVNNTANPGNTKRMAMGIGTAQWTYGRCTAYLDFLLNLYPGATTYTQEMLFNADYEYYKYDVPNNYGTMLDNIRSATTDEGMFIVAAAQYEAGFGYFQAVKKVYGDRVYEISTWQNASGVTLNGGNIDGTIHTLGNGFANRYKVCVQMWDALGIQHQ